MNGPLCGVVSVCLGYNLGSGVGLQLSLVEEMGLGLLDDQGGSHMFHDRISSQYMQYALITLAFPGLKDL